uniref:maturase K n=1 Tax=Xyris indica TaxID=2919641 RepID=UPI001F12FEF5|nr:maturase K [Xyris indica]ULQ68303.1 maturase K [Xyris indica]
MKGFLEKKKFHQQYLLYPLLFQEYIYAFAHDHGLKGSIFYEHVEILDYYKKFSSVLVKRLIIRVYQQDYLLNSSNHHKKNRLLFIGHNNFFYSHYFSQMISESFAVIMEMPFSMRLGSPWQEKGISKFCNLGSIHSVFPFLEDQFSHLSYVLDIVIPYPIHFEILIQIFQSRIQDIPSLHFFRFLFYEYFNSNGNSLIKKSNSFFVNKRFFQLLYNSYAFECEVLFFFLFKQSSFLRLTSSGTFLERIHFLKKINCFLVIYRDPNCLQKNLWFFVDFFMHYARYQEKAILVSKGTDSSMKKWKWYLVNLWQYYFHFWSQPQRIQINLLTNRSFYFLGYLSSVLENSFLVRSQMLENSFFMDVGIKQLYTIVPVITLIRSLYKSKFCTLSGHPISKPTWMDLSDCDIIDRFGWICRNLFHYYSGSSKKRNLYRIKYILRLSCARTLARKHKSTVRTFLQRLGLVFLEEFFTTEEVHSLIFPKTIRFSFHGSHKERFWHLDITCVNDLVSY